MKKQFELLEFVLIPFILTCSLKRFLISYCWVCEVVLVPYVVAVVAVTVMRVLLFVLHVCMLRECEGAKVTAMLVWGTEEVWLW